ncbi:TonB-dependent receptor domain-containing protein [Aestuariivivens marinum]|uniref:TonB-dependent receptor domain-containing protein n=1 Tax=Aestuariivivens marinum TaxID=2913555 RepID=UPI001F5855EC|nr:TonB-dependent receptor [Aestuariivivens marinum]
MIVLLAFSAVLNAQHKNPIETTFNIKKVVVSGKVIENETKQPLEYATVSFYSHKEKKIIDGTITDINGDFEIKVSDGIYDIKIEYISYKSHELKNQNIQSDINLGTISLELDIAALDAVEVIAEKTTVEIRLDKKIYNVGKDLTVSGGTVSDVLDNVPSVSVDIEGNVALRGNNNVRILINGKPSGLVGLNSTDALRQLPAEAIEKVEVITSPSARYEAQGTAGILNIILRRSKLQGFNGAITANGGHPTSGGFSGNTNFRTKDLNFFNTSAYNYNTSIGHSYNYTRYNNTGNYADEIRDWENTRKGLTTNFGIEWYINDSASLTTSVVYRDSDNEQNSTNVLTQFDENRDLLGETVRLDPEFSGSKTIQYATNFTKNFEEEGHKFTLDFQYEENNNDKLSLILTDGVNTDNLSTIEDQSSILLQTDYVLPIGENSQFELGYRGDFSTKSTDYEVEILNNQGQFEIDNNLSNLFNFKLYINALYAQYGSKIDKFSYLLGLRMENTQTTIDQPTTGDFKKKNITGLFPTVNLSYEFSEKESLTLGYSRRIERPRSYHLNPFPSRTSLTNIFQGNPDLDPSYSSLYDLGYLNRLDKLTLSSSIYLQREKNESNWVSYETGEIVNVNGQDLPVIARSPVNFATEKRYGFEFNVSYTPNRKWRINTDFNLYNNILKGEFNGVNFDNENLTWRTRLTNKYTLPGNIDWQTNLNYRGPSQDSQNKRDAIFSADLAFSKDLFKEKASVVVNISDILNSRRYKGDINTETFSSKRDLQFRGGRILKVSFTYRFNQKKKPERSGDGFGGGDMEM